MGRYIFVLWIICLSAFSAHAETQTVWSNDIQHFEDKDLPLWQSGHWSHQFHNGKMGWWWVVGEVWYLYPSATFPYPDPMRPNGVENDTNFTSGVRYRYYCSLPAGYYPYVNHCEHLWRRVASARVTVIVPPDTPKKPTIPIVTAPTKTTPNSPQKKQIFAARKTGVVRKKAETNKVEKHSKPLPATNNPSNLPSEPPTNLVPSPQISLPLPSSDTSQPR